MAKIDVTQLFPHWTLMRAKTMQVKVANYDNKSKGMAKATESKMKTIK